MKFGLIPEFIGRVPVTVTLDMLDKDAMIRILCEPKNALVKQYKKLFELDGVSLEFDKDALEAIVDKALEKDRSAWSSCNHGGCYIRSDVSYSIR